VTTIIEIQASDRLQIALRRTHTVENTSLVPLSHDCD
jgi:hypothetical protein